jgi:signal transduction histidine kinase
MFDPTVGNILKILVVDDDQADRKLVMRVMKQANLSCTFTEADSVTAAIARCAQTEFDFAFVDYLMPGEDGLSCIAYLHAHVPHIPVVMLTAHGNEMIAAQAIKAGAMDYISKKQVQPKSIRRVVEAVLRKAELLRIIAQQHEELERFTAVLVHDIRAPLTAVRSFARHIEAGLKSEEIDRETIIKHCQQIAKAVQRADALITALYRYTKLDSPVTLQPVNMHQIMTDTLFDLNSEIEARDAHITYGDLPVVAGNAPELGELLQNIVGNALKYCEAATPNIDVTVSPAGKSTWLFAVRDNGIGVSEMYRRKIFEPFERLHGTGKYGGTGIGLAICRKIIDRHGGSIWCGSNNNEQGTTFFFTLRDARRLTADTANEGC